jgi:Putative restriction endonuclease
MGDFGRCHDAGGGLNLEYPGKDHLATGRRRLTTVGRRLGCFRPCRMQSRRNDHAAFQQPHVASAQVVSPSNAGTDRLLQPQLYAAAGIGWYLRVEQPHDAVELHLERLVGDHYISAVVASPGQALVAEEPFPFELEIGSQLHRRRRG